MYIYSTYEFDGSREMSRELLARAFDNCMLDFASYEAADMGITGTDLVSMIEYTEHGKPYIKDWIEFSISHSGNAWAVLIATEPCGIDVQFAREGKLDEIADKYYTEEERELIEKEGVDAFWRVWTRREAAAKAVGATVFSRIPDVTGMMTELDGEEYWLYDIELLGADVAPYGAICTKEDPLSIHYYRL